MTISETVQDISNAIELDMDRARRAFTDEEAVSALESAQSFLTMVTSSRGFTAGMVAHAARLTAANAGQLASLTA